MMEFRVSNINKSYSISHYLKFYYDSIRVLSSVIKRVFLSHYLDLMLDYTLDFYNIEDKDNKDAIQNRLNLLTVEVLDKYLPFYVGEIARGTLFGYIYMEVDANGKLSRICNIMDLMINHISPEALGLLCEFVDDIPFKISDIVKCYDESYTEVIGDFIMHTGLDREFAVKVSDGYLEVMFNK